MKAKDIIDVFIEIYGLYSAVEVSIFRKDLYITFDNETMNEMEIENVSELYKLMALFNMLEVDFDLYE